ncbi:MAG: helix-turn-helix domain-containing protein [Dehalococcoidales bacterium]|nr:helix-turn-helix domain-containing protein [Dehalococcoidales bacterium]
MTTEIAKARTTDGVYNRPWDEKDLEYLNDNYGITPDAVVCRHLQRSVNALKIISYRKLGINRKSNIYTARMVADLLGVACSKTVTAWMRKGWLKGCKTTIRCGGGLIWNFPYENIESFVRLHPWFFNCSRMEESYFRAIVKEEFARDPWYSLPQACKFIGVSYNSSAMANYIKKHWLHPMKKPVEGGNHWTWVFRKSDLDAFMADDPRRYNARRSIASRQAKSLKEGRAIEFYMVWRMKCPVCHRPVRIEANAHIRGQEIKKLFTEKYCKNGTCQHHSPCRVERPPKPYKVRIAEGRRKSYPPRWPGK